MLQVLQYFVGTSMAVVCCCCKPISAVLSAGRGGFVVGKVFTMTHSVLGGPIAKGSESISSSG